MHYFQAHTVVSSQGACANAIMHSAGPGMLPQTHPAAGEIRVSPGFKLPCQNVIHTRCSEWNGGNGERVCILYSECRVTQTNKQTNKQLNKKYDFCNYSLT